VEVFSMRKLLGWAALMAGSLSGLTLTLLALGPALGFYPWSAAQPGPRSAGAVDLPAPVVDLSPVRRVAQPLDASTGLGTLVLSAARPQLSGITPATVRGRDDVARRRGSLTLVGGSDSSGPVTVAPTVPVTPVAPAVPVAETPVASEPEPAAQPTTTTESAPEPVTVAQTAPSSGSSERKPTKSFSASSENEVELPVTSEESSDEPEPPAVAQDATDRWSKWKDKWRNRGRGHWEETPAAEAPPVETPAPVEPAPVASDDNDNDDHDHGRGHDHDTKWQWPGRGRRD
jgi:hypothetical protein